MIVAVTGAGGMIGRPLVQALLLAGHQVNLLSTHSRGIPSANGMRVFDWSPDDGRMDGTALENADAVIHLAGFPVSSKWTRANKKRMTTSRVKSTEMLVEQLLKSQRRDLVFIAVSGAHYYAPSAGEVSESGAPGSGFLATLVHDWEAASAPLAEHSIRRVIFRLPQVLGRGGTIQALTPLFKAGLGVSFGPAAAPFSWVHQEDVGAMIRQALADPKMLGEYNAAAPGIATNRSFATSLARAMHKPFFLPQIPSFLLRLMLGKRSALILESNALSNARIRSTGFQFKFPELDGALQNLTGPEHG